jgi:hypothetical protein
MDTSDGASQVLEGNGDDRCGVRVRMEVLALSGGAFEGGTAFFDVSLCILYAFGCGLSSHLSLSGP